MEKSKHLEVLLWSIAFPGFGQYLNGKFLKGLTFLILEFVINIQSNLNIIIISSFQGQIESAIDQVDFRWLLFYPCVYLFAMRDAYRDAGGGKEPYAFLPFVLSAYMGTIGVIYLTEIYVYGRKWGPIWLSILFLIIGIGVGLIVKRMLTKLESKPK
ncbi:hypothetical protein [Ammoniphilus sp. YIM 78166]|uniref:hypothetical protein n=1 Tax=Ammoniphilus sp. YIM 78166 TaxID=1644106 RepID=UPI0010704C0A|nr:hypothetical protein [Ammoniphilus sp. YIM 78166]